MPAFKANKKSLQPSYHAYFIYIQVICSAAVNTPMITYIKSITKNIIKFQNSI